VAALADGSALVAGRITGEVIFGRGETGETTLRSDGNPPSSDVFVARYNANGTLAWAARAGGDSPDVAASVAALGNGSALVTGTFEDRAVFGAGEPAQIALESRSAAHTDLFVARYHPDGTLAWAQRAGGDANDTAAAIAAMPGGGALLAGHFWGSADFAGETLTSAGPGDIVLGRFDR
jgi:hypothetical protein